MENKFLKTITLSFIIFIALLCTASVAVFAQEETEPASTEASSAAVEETTVPTEPPKNGFVTENGDTYYYINGVKQNGLIKIKTDTYYFDKDGKMETGLIKVSGSTYYFNKDGKMKTGLIKISGSTYYFNKDGKMKTGLIKVSGNTYYFDKDGKMKTGLIKISGSTYYFNKDGKMKTGLIKVSGNTYYFDKDGKIKKGFIKLNGNTYYFKKDHKMKTGFAKLKKAVYYFAKDGRMKTGLTKISGKHYYFNKKGERQYGYKKIGKYRYYFKKNGAAKTGFHTRTFKKEKIKTYYDKKGRLKTGSFKVGKVSFKATKKIGKIYSCINNVPVICQRPELPTGCEIVSWTMMVNYAGVKISKTKAADIMPRSGDPNKGFSGSPYRSSGGALVVYPNGLKTITQNKLGSFTNLTKASLKTIKNKLFNKHLVLVWVAGLDGFYSHTVALTGYDREYFYYNDPWTGTARRMSYSSFLSMWSGNGKRAVSY